MTYIYYEVSFKTADGEIRTHRGNLKTSNYANKKGTKQAIITSLTPYQRENIVSMQWKYSGHSSSNVWCKYI